MIIQGIEIANLIIEMIGVMVSVFALIILMFGFSREKETTGYYTSAFISLLAYYLCLLCLQLLRGHSGPAYRNGIYLTWFGTYLFSIAAAFIVSCYVAAILSFTQPARRKIFALLTSVLVSGILLMAYGQLTGRLLRVTEKGMFIEGAWRNVGYIWTAIFMFLDLLMVLQHGKDLTLRQKSSIFVYLGLPLAAIFVRYRFPGIYIVALASCLALLFMLVVTVSEQTEIYYRQMQRSTEQRYDVMIEQIQPHFLFNSLYAIQEVCHTDQETAARAIGQFSRYLRHNIDGVSVKRMVPFTDELEHTRNYVELQQLRFGEMLHIHYDIGPESFSMPALVLQPLVAQVIRYGIRQRETGEGTVIISTKEFDDRYEIAVKDEGAEDSPETAVTSPKNGHRSDMKNIQERLQHMCGGWLDIERRSERETGITVVIPKNKNHRR